MQLLIVDDEAFLVENLARYLQKSLQAEIHTATTPEEAIKTLQEKAPDLVVCDLNIGGSGEGVLLRQIQRINPGVKFIIISAMKIPDDLDDLRQHILHYFEKPFNMHEFQEELENIIANNFHESHIN